MEEKKKHLYFIPTATTVINVVRRNHVLSFSEPGTIASRLRENQTQPRAELKKQKDKSTAGM